MNGKDGENRLSRDDDIGWWSPQQTVVTVALKNGSSDIPSDP